MNDFVNSNLELLKSQKIIIFDNDGLKLAELHPLSMESMPKIEEISYYLSEWRNKSMRFFFTGFKATPERTLNWLKSSIIPSSSKILYLIYVDEKLIGHFGLANITLEKAELDNAIRGVKGGHPDLFKYTEFVILDLAFNFLKVDSVYGNLFSNNFLAMTLHKQFGFAEKYRKPLKLIRNQDEWEYVICRSEEASERFDLSHIVLTEDKFIDSIGDKISYEFL